MAVYGLWIQVLWIQSCGSNFSLIKVQNASETSVFYKLKAFNFSLKIFSVLAKQLA